MLKDHKITDAEYAEAEDSEASCLRAQGYEPTVDTEQGVRVVNVPADADSTCSDKYVGPIEQLYLEQKTNPGNENQYDLVAACFVRNGLVKPGFTGKDLQEIDEEGVTSFRVSDGATTDYKAAAATDPTLPSGLQLYGEKTQPCWDNPRTAGTGSGQ